MGGAEPSVVAAFLTKVARVAADYRQYATP
jgi:hypothetical protein